MRSSEPFVNRAQQIATVRAKYWALLEEKRGVDLKDGYRIERLSGHLNGLAFCLGVLGDEQDLPR